MKTARKLLTSLLTIGLLAMSFQGQAQTKKFLEKLRSDTTNHKISINVKRDIYVRDSIQEVLRKKTDIQKRYFYESELKKYNFKIQYDSLIIKDKLEKAEQLVKKKLSNKELRETITGELRMFKAYYIDDQARLLEAESELERLLEKRRPFKKKFKELTKPKNLEGYLEGEELAQRCINYGKRINYPTTEHVKYYDQYARAKILDEHIKKADLEKITKKKKTFLKTMKPYLEAEDMDKYIEAMNLLDTIELYARTAPKVKLKRKEFISVHYKLQRLIEREREYLNYDKLAKKGKNYGIQQLRSDTANPEGIFVFNDKIVVIKSFNSEYNMISLIEGDGRQQADKMLVRYADENDNKDKHSKANERVKGGKAIPYFVDGSIQKVYSEQGLYQIRVSYDVVRNKSFTNQLKEGIRPVDIDTNYYGLIHKDFDMGWQVSFYRNQEGSFAQYLKKDSLIIISEYGDSWGKNTKTQDHAIDKVVIVDRRKRRKPKTTMYEFNVDKGIEEKNMAIYKRYQGMFNRVYSRSKKEFPKSQH